MWIKDASTWLIDIMGLALVFFAVSEAVVRAAIGTATVCREIWKKFKDNA